MTFSTPSARSFGDGAPSNASGHFIVTYASLQGSVARKLAQEGRSHQQIANMKSALHAWTRILKIGDTAAVGKELSDDFLSQFRYFQDEYATQASPRTCKDRAEQILLWKRHYEDCLLVDNLPASFTAALMQAVTQSGLTKAEICRRSGVPKAALENWLNGDVLLPPASVARIPPLEDALGLPHGTLSKRLPATTRARYERSKGALPPQPTAFAQRLMENRKRNPIPSLPPTERFRAQWIDLIRFKADITRPEADMRNTWRMKSPAAVGHHVVWTMLCDGQVCATASVHYGFISRYLGFLAAPAPLGRGKPHASCDTLGWLASVPNVTAYTQLMRRRAGNITHHGVLTFIASVRSHLRPVTGFVWNRSELCYELASAGEPFARVLAERDWEAMEAGWREHCEKSYKALVELEKTYLRTTNVVHSRDPAEPLSAILSEPSPLKVLVQLIARLEADEPPMAHHRSYVAWIRDVCLLKMLVSNPLRVSQLCLMSFRGSKPNLYCNAEGEWRLRFEPSDFKNEKGAARERYDSSVEPSCFVWIRRYLAEARPYMCGAETDRFFLPAASGPRRGNGALKEQGIEAAIPWTGDGMTKRLKVVTTRYLPGTPGFGGHAFRHIIATDHLKRHPRDYLTVAHLLHDTLATVMDDYAHLEVDDGLRTLHAGVAEAMREVERERQARP
ncbi:hypothetical protein WQE_15226 [Paraburkholderia hospita]|uniref:Tyr recombinase domain-containing protein n=1 Tax=Paraburkholderia hospita TaxID=169430 RepID=A0ABN0FNN2_9BURK|nr:hypothetical protein [Paraburkholderia hospita]EIN00394.1 hypothetical protein WQE_15226 [Paraburkholderia hospita]